MVKKKFALTTDMIDIQHQSPLPQSQLTKDKRVTVTIALDSDYRTQIKTWCVRHGITMQEAFKQAFDQLMS